MVKSIVKGGWALLSGMMRFGRKAKPLNRSLARNSWFEVGALATVKKAKKPSTFRRLFKGASDIADWVSVGFVIDEVLDLGIQDGVSDFLTESIDEFRLSYGLSEISPIQLALLTLVELADVESNHVDSQLPHNDLNVQWSDIGTKEQYLANLSQEDGMATANMLINQAFEIISTLYGDKFLYIYAMIKASGGMVNSNFDAFLANYELLFNSKEIGEVSDDLVNLINSSLAGALTDTLDDDGYNALCKLLTSFSFEGAAGALWDIADDSKLTKAQIELIRKGQITPSRTEVAGLRAAYNKGYNY